MQSYTTYGLQAYIVFIWVHTSRLSHVDGIPGKAKWLKQESSVQVYAKCSNVRSVNSEVETVLHWIYFWHGWVTQI